MKLPVFRYGQPLLSPRAGNILGVILSAIFVVSALIVYRELSALQFWVSVIFFGGCGYFSLRDLLYSKKAEISAEQRTAEYYKRRQEETGYFTYTSGGFTFDLRPEKPYYQWMDIQAIFAYSTTYSDDRSMTTEITLEIFFEDNKCIFMMESLPGWPQFNKRLSEEIPGFPGDWEQTFNNPNIQHTGKWLLYDKKGRTRDAAEKEYYQHADHQS